MASVTTLSSKFQISIPKDVREANGWKAGQRFAFIPTPGGLVLAPAPEPHEMRGRFRGANNEDIRDRNDRY
jgi:AbrB family looped-hinge helix DNA binding protein